MYILLTSSSLLYLGCCSYCCFCSCCCCKYLCPDKYEAVVNLNTLLMMQIVVLVVFIYLNRQIQTKKLSIECEKE